MRAVYGLPAHSGHVPLTRVGDVGAWGRWACSLAAGKSIIGQAVPLVAPGHGHTDAERAAVHEQVNRLLTEMMEAQFTIFPEYVGFRRGLKSQRGKAVG